MYAIIRDRGKQYKVKEGDRIELFRLPAADKKELTFTEILYYENGADVRIGKPTVENVKVHGEVLDHTKGPKVVAVKFRKRESFRRKRGQRAHLSVIRINKIEA